MTTIDTRNFLKWTSIAIQIENPKITKSASIKMAVKELQKEKKCAIIFKCFQLNTKKKIQIFKKENL